MFTNLPIVTINNKSYVSRAKLAEFLGVDRKTIVNYMEKRGVTNYILQIENGRKVCYLELEIAKEIIKKYKPDLFLFLESELAQITKQETQKIETKDKTNEQLTTNVASENEIDIIKKEIELLKKENKELKEQIKQIKSIKNVNLRNAIDITNKYCEVLKYYVKENCDYSDLSAIYQALHDRKDKLLNANILNELQNKIKEIETDVNHTLNQLSKIKEQLKIECGNSPEINILNKLMTEMAYLISYVYHKMILNYYK